MKYFLLIISILLTTACSNKTETLNRHYALPETNSGKLCVNQCERDKESCFNNYETDYKDCLQKTQKDIRDSFNGQEHTYQQQQKEYDSKLNNYDKNMAIWNAKNDKLGSEYVKANEHCISDKKSAKTCQEADRLIKEIDTLYRSKPIKPSNPIQPMLSNELEKGQSQCQEKHNCQNRYNNCFISCGGEIQ